ncbi:MAG: hypothetical protein ACRD1Y_07220, partial [Terriglobales bacterium]
DTAALIEAARQLLPAWSVPKEIHILETMPLNANGKVDRKALAQKLGADRQANSLGVIGTEGPGPNRN